MNIYSDIAARTGGDIYIGVVGPVRTGKSTFVAKFMEKVVLPNVKDKNVKKRAVDELPQSADGKTVMTTQPNFVPNEAVSITFADKTRASVRLIDCVGYLVDGVIGHVENDKPRLVNTPWSAKPMPFEKAAETGTEKVIKEHSTIAVVVTTDGTITEIPRANYVAAETRVVKELKQMGKPFVVVLNSKTPTSADCESLAQTLTEKYGAAVIPVDVANLTVETAEDVLSHILQEFPVRAIKIDLPRWMRTLSGDNRLIASLIARVKEKATEIEKMRQCKAMCEMEADADLMAPVVSDMDMGTGVVRYTISPQPELFYRVLSEQAACDVKDEFSLMNFVVTSAFAKTKYEHLRAALDDAAASGYGIVCPDETEMELDDPEIVKQGTRFGVRLKATAPTLHILKVDVTSEVAPIVGTEQQSQYLMREFESNPKRIWQTNMFGKSLSDLAREGLTEKCSSMPVDAQTKLVKAVGRILNEGKGGLICLLL